MPESSRGGVPTGTECLIILLPRANAVLAQERLRAVPAGLGYWRLSHGRLSARYGDERWRSPLLPCRGVPYEHEPFGAGRALSLALTVGELRLHPSDFDWRLLVLEATTHTALVMALCSRRRSCKLQHGFHPLLTELCGPSEFRLSRCATPGFPG